MDFELKAKGRSSQDFELNPKPTGEAEPFELNSKPSEVAVFLTDLNLAEYVQSFEQNAIGMDVLLELTEAELKTDVGISKLGHRRMIMAAIAKRKQDTRDGVASSAPTEPPATVRQAPGPQHRTLGPVSSPAVGPSSSYERTREALQRCKRKMWFIDLVLMPIAVFLGLFCVVGGLGALTADHSEPPEIVLATIIAILICGAPAVWFIKISVSANRRKTTLEEELRGLES